MTKKIRIGISEDIYRLSYMRNLYGNILNTTSTIEFKKVISPQEYLLNLFNMDIFHLHWPEKRFRTNLFLLTIIRTFFMIIIISFYKISGGKFVVTAHNIKPHIKQSRIWDYLVLLYSYRSADALLVHSNSTKKRLMKFYNINHDKIFVIRMGSTRSDDDFAKTTPSREDSAAALNIDENKLIITLLGNIVAYKGVELFMQISKEVLSYSNEYLFIVAGKCRDRILAQKLTENSIKYPNNFIFRNKYIEADVFPQYFSITDLGLVPFEQITDSSSFELYLRYNRPILTSYFHSLHEIAGDFAFYQKTRDAKIWCKKIIDLFEGEKISNKRDEITKHYTPYSWSDTASNTIMAYIQVLNT